MKVLQYHYWRKINTLYWKWRWPHSWMLPDYFSLISDRPFFPSNLHTEHYVAKEKKEWTSKDKVVVLIYAKERNLLYSRVDNFMSNKVIRSKTVKKIWDALEVQCQETKGIMKKTRIILIQEYKHLDSKADESLTNIYDIFLNIFSDIALVRKRYNNEESNTKFFWLFMSNGILKPPL